MPEVGSRWWRMIETEGQLFRRDCEITGASMLMKMGKMEQCCIFRPVNTEDCEERWMDIEQFLEKYIPV